MHPLWCVPALCTAGSRGGRHRGRVHRLGLMEAQLVAATLADEPGVLLSRAGVEVTVSVPELQALWTLSDALLDELDGPVPADGVFGAG